MNPSSHDAVLGKGFASRPGSDEADTESFKPHVEAPGKYTVKAAKDKPNSVVAKGVEVA